VLLNSRLRNQRLTGSGFGDAASVVRWFGAMQSQDYVGAKWAVGLRAPRLDDSAVERAYNHGTILRTHVLRPTWHFVARDDIRWLVSLTGPRVQGAMRRYGANVGLTASVYKKARTVIERALDAGAHLTRKQLATALQAASIEATGLRLAFLIMDVELEGVVCSGRLEDRQFTYALVSERAPRAKVLSRDESLAELATRFMQSHGPATLKDFAWWSGLTMRDARAGVALSGVDVLASPPPLDVSRGATYLLSNYDEYLIAYKDRGAVIDASRSRNLGTFTTREFPHQIILDGRVAGSWKRTIDRKTVGVRARPYVKLSRVQRQALTKQAERYGRFLGLVAEVDLDG
jgi:hypothetical protein